jgi:hypothetical protein
VELDRRDVASIFGDCRSNLATCNILAPAHDGGRVRKFGKHGLIDLKIGPIEQTCNKLRLVRKQLPFERGLCRGELLRRFRGRDRGDSAFVLHHHAKQLAIGSKSDPISDREDPRRRSSHRFVANQTPLVATWSKSGVASSEDRQLVARDAAKANDRQVDIDFGTLMC